MDSSTFPKRFTCFICMNYFMDPVTIGCGHSFCRPCLCTCWEEAQHPPSCPMCKKTSHQTTFETNIVLRTRVFLVKRARATHLASSAEQMCGVHMKPNSYFCEVDQDLICLLCSRSEEHRDHRHCAIDWTAEEYRKTLLKQMRSLWEKRQENQRNLDQETSILQNWMDYVKVREKMIRNEYWRVCHLVYEEEQHHLERLEKESQEIFQKLKESEDRMVLKGKLLREMYEELKEMCHKPDIELLQHFRNILKRIESVQLHTPKPVTPQLSCWPITGLIDMLHRFQVHVSWDNQKVTHQVSLFEDLRRLLFHPNHFVVTPNSTRSKDFIAWGAQSFAFGRYYWEVDVGDCGNWVVGFCDDSWTMRNDMLVNSKGVFLLFCVQEDNGCRLFTSSPLLPQYIERPQGQVGVFLDYEFHRVSFVNVANSSPICSLLSCSFSSPLRPFLCFG